MSRAGRLSAPRAARPHPSALEAGAGLGIGARRGPLLSLKGPVSGREFEGEAVNQSGGGSGELPILRIRRAPRDPDLPERRKKSS